MRTVSQYMAGGGAGGNHGAEANGTAAAAAAVAKVKKSKFPDIKRMLMYKQPWYLKI